MKMYVDGTLVPTSFEDNAATKELALHLPLRISMSRYGGFEQVGPIGYRLPTADEPIDTKPGDIMLYMGNQIVLFFGENSWSYTRLGRMDLDQVALRNLLDKRGVTLTLE